MSKEFVSKAAGVLSAFHGGLKDDRGTRAQLRRARIPGDVYLCPAFHARICAPVEEAYGPLSEWERNALAAATGLLAHVSDGNFESDTLGRLMAGGKPDMHPLRFRRLLALDKADDLFADLRRAIVMVGKRANPTDLLWAFLNWDNQRKRWATDYYSIVRAG